MDETKTSTKGNKRPASDDEEEPPPAKKASLQANMCEPIQPTLDPCSPSYDIRAHANTSNQNAKEHDTTTVVSWVIYLAVQESTVFQQTLAECKTLAATTLTPEFSDRLQLDGTRHITLWTGSMTQAQAAGVEFAHDAIPHLPIANITFPNYFTKNGAYLALSEAMEDQLKETIVEELEGLPSSKGKVACNHLSLYRSRGMNWGKFQQACSQIRQAFPAPNWGSVQGVSVRLKVVGSDYSHCRVLAGV